MTVFHDKVIYQIYPKSFCDSNGDGIGDIPGITKKLPYLEQLGVDYLWLTPIFCSPQKDNGYDVSDYMNIDPLFGTMADLEELIAKAKQKNIQLMLDMVFNHTSTSHEWFQKALNGDSDYQDYYIFKEGPSHTPPTNWQSKFGGSAWEYVPSLQKWYLHLFDRSQADLNWDNPKVREELKKIVLFWKNKGIGGFRFDVINLISKPLQWENDYEGDGRRFYTDGPYVHQYIHELIHDTQIASLITVGEMSSTSIEHCIRYSSPKNEELSMVFNFHHLKVDYLHGNKWALTPPDLPKLKQLFASWQEEMTQGNGWNALFWCNHDQPRIVSRFGNDSTYWDISAKLLAGILHLMRGTPYIYQGEELGMTNAYFTSISQYKDVESLNYYQILLNEGLSKDDALEILRQRSRDNSRTPMCWNKNSNAGFTTGTPWISIPTYKPQANVLEQEQDSNSIYAFYQKLIRLRKKFPIIAKGDIHFTHVGHPYVMAYERSYKGQQLFVYGNLTEKETRIDVPFSSYLPQQLFLNNYKTSSLVSQGHLFLKPYELIALLF